MLYTGPLNCICFELFVLHIVLLYNHRFSYCTQMTTMNLSSRHFNGSRQQEMSHISNWTQSQSQSFQWHGGWCRQAFLCLGSLWLDLSVWSLHILSGPVWVSSGRSSFLPQSRLIGDFKLPVGVNVSVKGCLSLWVSRVMNWQPVRRVRRLSPNGISSTSLQPCKR